MSKYNVDIEDLCTKLFPRVLREADFIASGGDMAYGDTLDQDVYLILYSGKGNFYQSPRIGMNIHKKLNSSINKAQLKKEIIENLKEDNIKASDIQLITYDDISRLGITDTELISRIKQDKLIISIKASR